jgi:hypothetical protein
MIVQTVSYPLISNGGSITHVDVVLIAGTCGFLVLAVGFACVFARLISQDRITVPPEPGEELFSPARYRLMERLLEEANEKCLASQSDGGADVEKKFRNLRIKIFRGYMQQLSDDFNHIHKVLKGQLVQSDVERPDVAGRLMKQQFLFAFSMMRIELKLMLYGWGWRGMDVRSVTESLDRMRNQLQSLAALAEPAPL